MLGSLDLGGLTLVPKGSLTPRRFCGKVLADHVPTLPISDHGFAPLSSGFVGGCTSHLSRERVNEHEGGIQTGRRDGNGNGSTTTLPLANE